MGRCSRVSDFDEWEPVQADYTMKARIVLAIVVTSCAGAWAVVSAVLQKALVRAGLPVERWLRRGRYKNDSRDNYKKHWGGWE